MSGSRVFHKQSSEHGFDSSSEYNKNVKWMTAGAGVFNIQLHVSAVNCQQNFNKMRKKTR